MIKALNSTLSSIKNPFVAVLALILYIAVIAAVAYGVFWLFTWAVLTLFHFEIAMTFINWLAFVVLMIILKARVANTLS